MVHYLIPLIILLLSCCSISYAQVKDVFEFSLLRQNDNIDTLLQLANSQKNLYQRAKLLKLSQNTSLSFGGSWRYQMESFKNQRFVDIDNGNRIWLMNRFLFNSHLRFKNGEIYGELLSSCANGKNDLSPVDAEKMDINQLFIKYKITPSIKVGIGRENLKLGSGRVIDPREGPGVRRAFDMVQVKYSQDDLTVHAFFGATGSVQPEIFDNRYLDFKETLTAVYTTKKLDAVNNLDTYFMYQKDDDVNYSNISGNERRALLGARHFGSFGSVDFNNEIFFQFGSIADQRIRAWAIALQAEKKIKFGDRPATLGFKSNLISGDTDPDDKVNNTFDPFYPRGAYFGRVASFTPSNFIDLHPYINMNVNNFFFEVDYDIFWRYSVRDALYNPSMQVDYADLNDRRFIAYQIGTVMGYKPNNFINIELESNIVCPGTFLKESGRNRTMVHVVLGAEFSF
ncbi:alginate export family protein [Sphingobacterium detergens]|uniref:Alginate export protein n=1 Tax=Sphingobacterium detergens TaxID=1145106 RepID=A0A420BL49_SPHD1|nr:alginate export family protein [Sphingobacterium detergens]RKE57306.1 alginate export protein [Sphingobacterium detergens]